MTYDSAVQGERYLYYIVEHPTFGVLVDLEETPSGNVGRFSIEGMRGGERTERFATKERAFDAIDQITHARKSHLCRVRASQWMGTGWDDAWPVVSRG